MPSPIVEGLIFLPCQIVFFSEEFVSKNKTEIDLSRFPPHLQTVAITPSCQKG